MNIGLRIKELREKKNLSQEEFGELIGVSKQMISHYESGTNVPRSGKIKRIADIFKITEEEFYTSKTVSNLTSNNEDQPLTREYLMSENQRLHAKLEEILEKKNNDKDKIIELMERINELNEKLRKIGQ
jgi:transcriptional regulator with XRE-family HTH domain